MNGRRQNQVPKQNQEIVQDCFMAKYFTINSKRNTKTMICKLLNSKIHIINIKI